MGSAVDRLESKPLAGNKVRPIITVTSWRRRRRSRFNNPQPPFIGVSSIDVLIPDGRISRDQVVANRHYIVIPFTKVHGSIATLSAKTPTEVDGVPTEAGARATLRSRASERAEHGTLLSDAQVNGFKWHINCRNRRRKT